MMPLSRESKPFEKTHKPTLLSVAFFPEIRNNSSHETRNRGPFMVAALSPLLAARFGCSAFDTVDLGAFPPIQDCLLAGRSALLHSQSPPLPPRPDSWIQAFPFLILSFDLFLTTHTLSR